MLTSKQPSNAPNYIDNFKNVQMNHIIQINNNLACSMCSKCPPPARIHDLRLSRHWSITASMTFYVQSQPKFVSSIFAGHRCHKSLFCTCIVA